MREIIIRECPKEVMEEEQLVPVRLSEDVYVERFEELRKRLVDKNLDYAILYGDREHFANIEYFTRYDCRFEEALLIIGADGSRTIVVGNEGEAYCRNIPFEIEVKRYRNFSLQGQPRDGSPTLEQVYQETGISKGSRIGLAGYKYFSDENWFDIPEYIVKSLRKVVHEENIVNFTKELTGLPDGIRMKIRKPEEMAVIDYQAGKVANVMRRLLKSARPGISEQGLSGLGGIDFAPQQTHSMLNFGAQSVSMGIRSPSPFVHLICGGPMSIAFSQRGSLMCRAAFASSDMDSVLPEYRPLMETHLKPYWSVVALWYESIRVGCECGSLYDKIYDIIGDPKFGFTLNPGHYIGGDEWVNSEFLSGSKVCIHNGSHIQCDIIVASGDPVLSAICEDTIVVADKGLQLEYEKAYPELYQKVKLRKAFMREKLGIQVTDDIMPMSIMNAVMFPFMLNTSKMFAYE